MHTGNYFIENRKLANGERSAAHTCTLEHSHTHPLCTLSRISAHSHRHERERELVSRAPLSARRVRQKQPRQHITRAVGNPRVFPPARAGKGYLRRGASRNRPVRTGVRAPPTAAPPACGVAEAAAVLYRAAAATVRSHHIDRRGASGAHHRS
jgi:hypothetical protein